MPEPGMQIGYTLGPRLDLLNRQRLLTQSHQRAPAHTVTPHAVAVLGRTPWPGPVRRPTPGGWRRSYGEGAGRGALGAEPLVRLADLPLEGLRRALEMNVVAPLGIVQHALPLLRRSSYWESYGVDSPYRGGALYAEGKGNKEMSDSSYYGGSDVEPERRPGGAVLTLSSDAAVEAYPTWGGYGAAKAALDRQSAVLAVEEPGLRVWRVDPGDMQTDLYAAAVPDDDSDRPLPETVVPALLRLLDDAAPSGRYTAAELLAGAGTGASDGVGAR
ncbi:hypothetical protein JCM4914_58120 [Streptomyces platensis subsp. malvinus]